MAGRRVTRGYHGVWLGPMACMKLIQAYQEAPEQFEIDVDVGTNDGELLVVVSLGGVNCAFTPDELLTFCRSLIDSARSAERMGAPPEMIRDIVRFASGLIEHADEARSISAHGLH